MPPKKKSTQAQAVAKLADGVPKPKHPRIAAVQAAEMHSVTKSHGKPAQVLPQPEEDVEKQFLLTKPAGSSASSASGESTIVLSFGNKDKTLPMHDIKTKLPIGTPCERFWALYGLPIIKLIFGTCISVLSYYSVPRTVDTVKLVAHLPGPEYIESFAYQTASFLIVSGIAIWGWMFSRANHYWLRETRSPSTLRHRRRSNDHVGIRNLNSGNPWSARVNGLFRRYCVLMVFVTYLSAVVNSGAIVVWVLMKYTPESWVKTWLEIFATLGEGGGGGYGGGGSMSTA